MSHEQRAEFFAEMKQQRRGEYVDAFCAFGAKGRDSGWEVERATYVYGLKLDTECLRRIGDRLQPRGIADSGIAKQAEASCRREDGT
jgi:hypothetical protein